MLGSHLFTQVEELKTLPENEVEESAPAMAAKALDRVLNAAGGSSSSSATPVVVNDLTSIVKKKKKVAPPAPVEAARDVSPAKRKAETDAEPLNIDKKPKLDSPEA